MKNFSSNAQKTISIFIIAFAFFFPHYGGFPFFSYAVIVLIVVWLFLRYFTGENFEDIFFRFKNFRLRSIWMGAVAAVILFAILQYGVIPVFEKFFPGRKIDLHDFDFIRGHFINYILVLVAALLVGGFYEELIFHGFVFTRLEKIFGKYKTLIAFILTAFVFAAYHFQQGIFGMVNAGLAGAAYHSLILKNGRNLWYGLFFHAFYDFIGLSFIYAGHN